MFAGPCVDFSPLIIIHSFEISSQRYILSAVAGSCVTYRILSGGEKFH
jgi:hypothetical protein